MPYEPKLNQFDLFQQQKEKQQEAADRAKLQLKAERESLLHLFKDPAWGALQRVIRARQDIFTAVLFTADEHEKLLDARASIRELQRLLDLPELMKLPPAS